VPKVVAGNIDRQRRTPALSRHACDYNTIRLRSAILNPAHSSLDRLGEALGNGLHKDAKIADGIVGIILVRFEKALADCDDLEAVVGRPDVD
jgi:hypothetical protein